jgi:hypothetical protein
MGASRGPAATLAHACRCMHAPCVLRLDSPEGNPDAREPRRSAPRVRRAARRCDHDSPRGRHDSLQGNRDSLASARDSPSMRRDSPPPRRGAPPLRAGAPLPRHDSPLRNRDSLEGSRSAAREPATGLRLAKSFGPFRHARARAGRNRLLRRSPAEISETSTPTGNISTNVIGMRNSGLA